MNALVEISQNLAANTPQWALKVTHEMITQWKKVGKAYNLDVSLPPFVIKLDVNVGATDEEVPVHESDEGSFTVQVSPNPPYYIEFPDGELDEDISADEGFKPYSKELWPHIIKDYISTQSTIGFVFVCETQITEDETGTVKDALLAQYQGYGGLTVTYCQHFKFGEGNLLSFGEIEEVPENNASLLKALDGLFDRRLDKEVVN